MNLFLIKFHDIDNEAVVYDALHELAEGKAFVPFDNHTFILRTHKDFAQVKRKLTFEIDTSYNFIAVDITRNNPDDFFIDNSLELKHLRDFIHDAQTHIDEEQNWQVVVDKLLDKISDKGIDKMSKDEMDTLRKYSKS